MMICQFKLTYHLSISRIYTPYRSDIEMFVRILKTYWNKFNLGILSAIPTDAYRRIAGLGESYNVVKVRIKNSNTQKGKSAGYRLIYQVESLTNVLLLTIYSKSDRHDISPTEILDILSSISED